jgi:glutamate/tyrosine decarboxylase-like PLP-dependent enzyme
MTPADDDAGGREADLAALAAATRHAESWLREVAARPVAAPADYDVMRRVFSGPLPAGGADPVTVVDDLAARAGPGLAAMDSERFFGWVTGGSLPAARASDLLVSAWDQNNGINAITPATTAIARQAGEWLVAALGLPVECTVGWVTGGCMANFTGLAVGRHHVLAAAGWDVESDGLAGGPPLTVIASEERHETVNLALRYLGIGSARVTVVPTDDQGRIQVRPALQHLADSSGPTLLVLAAGNVNSGSCDRFADLIPAAQQRGAWVHVDGAFGLWGAASPRTAAALDGVAQADSWAVDAHKWLNVPYDCGAAIVRHPESHRATFGIASSYLQHSGGYPDPVELVPEYSQRARAVPVWAALRQLGGDGVIALVDDCCDAAQRFAAGYRSIPGVAVVNEVVLNQVLLRVHDSDRATDEVVRRVVDSGEAMVNRAVWQSRVVMRTSVSNFRTDAAAVDRTVAAVRAAVSAVAAH